MIVLHMILIEFQITVTMAKELNQSKLKIEEEGKANSNSKSQTPLQHRYKRKNTLMKIPIITTTMTITEVNLEAIDPIEAKLLDNFSEVKILMVDTNATKIHIKVNTKVTIVKAITTKVLMVNTTTHIEAIIRLIIMANFARCYCSQVGLFSLFSALLLLLQLCQRFLLLWLCSNVLRLLGNVVRVP